MVNSKSLNLAKIGSPPTVTPVIGELLREKWTKSPEILTEGSNRIIKNYHIVFIEKVQGQEFPFNF
jgi:hypothetical protein